MRPDRRLLLIVLAGDVGGTNARIATIEVNGDVASILRQERYDSADFPGLAPIVQQFCERLDQRPDRACFGLPCPMVGEDCTAPNLPWAINRRQLASAIRIPATAIINDFAAIGYGVPLLRPADLAVLQAGQAVPRGPIALIGAGTGLGHGFLLWERDHYRVVASEGGHADFAPGDELQIGMLRSLRGRFGRVSWERLISGPGLLNIYTYLREAGVADEQAAVRAEIEGEDPAPVIGRHGLARSDALCDRTLNLFSEILGAQAGNLALTVVSTGGVYIGGGIAPRLLERLRDGRLLAAFRNKGRLSEILARMPLYVIINPNVGLLGAAAFAAREGSADLPSVNG
jgi:glucokinase